LTGLILSIISFSILALVCLVFFIDAAWYFSYIEENYFIWLFFGFFLCSIMGILFSAFGISIWQKPHSIYLKKRFYVLIAFILFCLIILLEIIFILLDGYFDYTFYLLNIILFIISAVFTMIGYTRDDNLANNQADNFLDKTFERLEKLGKLREMNIINEDEYAEIRNKLVDNCLK
jgi:peptidoglycan/LPS O-acetylase OafA/YrhL